MVSLPKDRHDDSTRSECLYDVDDVIDRIFVELEQIPVRKTRTRDAIAWLRFCLQARTILPPEIVCLICQHVWRNKTDQAWSWIDPFPANSGFGI